MSVLLLPGALLEVTDSPGIVLPCDHYVTLLTFESSVLTVLIEPLKKLLLTARVRLLW